MRTRQLTTDLLPFQGRRNRLTAALQQDRCVCPPMRPLITSDVMWCNIDRVRLIKQVLRLFPAFNYFIQQLPLIKWMGVAILTQHIVNACQ